AATAEAGQGAAAAFEGDDKPTRSLATTLRGHRRGERRDGGPDTARTVAASLANPTAGAAGGNVDMTPELVHRPHGSVGYGARRNLAAAGAGAVLIAVLATIV